MQVDLLSAFVESGPTPDEAVRRVSKAAILAWALELAVPLALGETVNVRQVDAEYLGEGDEPNNRPTPASAKQGFKEGGALSGSTCV